MLESIVHYFQIFHFHLLCWMNRLHYFFCARCNIVWLQNFVRFRIRPFSMINTNFRFNFAHFHLSKNMMTTVLLVTNIQNVTNTGSRPAKSSPWVSICLSSGLRDYGGLPETAMKSQCIWLPVFPVTNKCPIKTNQLLFVIPCDR